MNLRIEPGFLGTDASMLSDLTLLAYILILLPLMAVGYYYARRKRFEPQHKLVMTGITLFNWVLILFVMVASFSDSVAPNIPDNLSDNVFLFPTIHLVTGGVAQVLATYLVARMWLEGQLPGWAKVKNIKLYMRVTLTLWVVTAVLGIVIYFTWYSASPAQADDVPLPVVTEEPDAPGENALDDPVVTEEPTVEATSTEAVVPDPVMTEEPTPVEDVPAPAATEEA